MGRLCLNRRIFVAKFHVNIVNTEVGMDTDLAVLSSLLLGPIAGVPVFIAIDRTQSWHSSFWLGRGERKRACVWRVDWRNSLIRGQ